MHGTGNYLQEDIEYGINNNWSINGSVTNVFDTEGIYNNSHNFVYSLGTTYNTTVDNIILHASAAYTTLNPKDFFGHHTPKRWEKVLSGELGVGYDMGNGLTPYAIYGIEGNVDTADRYLEQSVLAGVHKYSGDYAFDVAARYDYNTDGRNTNQWWGLASADYYLRKISPWVFTANTSWAVPEAMTLIMTMLPAAAPKYCSNLS